MKSTDLARRDRDIRKSRKKEFVLERKTRKGGRTPGDFINELTGKFFYDTERIYNINESEDILVLLEEMKEEIPEKQWINVIRKSVKKTGVKQKDAALDLLTELASLEMVEQ